MRLNYTKHLGYSLLLTAAAVIICSSIGLLVDQLEIGVVSGLGLGLLYLVLGLVLGYRQEKKLQKVQCRCIDPHCHHR